MSDKWYWYLERTNEILLDIDKPTKLVLSLSRQKASGFVRKSVVHASSGGSGFHLQLELFEECYIGDSRIDAWNIQWDRFKDVLRVRFLDDPYRAQIGSLRELEWILSPNHLVMYPLLISRKKWEHRESDFTCECPSKDNHVSGDCQIARLLRADKWSRPLLGRMPEKIDPAQIGLGVYFEFDAIP